MGPEIQAMFLQIVVPAAFTILAALITFGGKKLISYIDAKTKTEHASAKTILVGGILARLTAAVQTVVLDVNGTIKADMIAAAADGKITDEEKAEIKDRALTRLKTHIGLKGLAEIVEILGISPSLLDTFLGSHLEAAIEGSKDRSGVPGGGTIDPTVSSTDPAVTPDPK